MVGGLSAYRDREKCRGIALQSSHDDERYFKVMIQLCWMDGVAAEEEKKKETQRGWASGLFL